MDLIDREKALACFDGWYNPIRDEWHDVEEIPGYEKLEELPIVAEVEDCISRQDAIDAIRKLSQDDGYINLPHEYVTDAVRSLPSAQPEAKEIGYAECANAMLKMWIDNVLTDGEYNRIMDKLNEHWGKVNERHNL